MPRAKAREPLHVTFGDSTAGSLIQALGIPRKERFDRIARLNDHLNIGPIAPAEPRARARWCREEVMIYDRARIKHINAFWRAVVAADDLIVWMSSRDAHELCGFMELVWRRRRPLRVIDVAAVRLPRSDADLKRSTGPWRPQQIVKHRLLERARRVEMPEVEAVTAAWEELADERTQLRVATRAGLLGVPLSHFDEALVAGIGGAWLRCAIIIANVFLSYRTIGYDQVDEAFLYWRLLWLIDAGVLEGQGDVRSFLTLSVRRVTV